MADAILQKAIVWVPNFREWGVAVNDGGTSFIEIKYCPWCGESLPDSLRDDWFNRAKEMGVEPPYNRMPKQFKSETWWIQDKRFTGR